MKSAILARVGAVFIGLAILVLFQVTTSYAARDGTVGDRLSTAKTCVDDSGVFPAFITTRIGLSKNGFFSGFEVYISGIDGVCSTLLYSSSLAKY